MSSQLVPITLDTAQRSTIEFKARLKQDMLGIPADSLVDVGLDLFSKGTINIAGNIAHVQLIFRPIAEPSN